MNSGIMHALLCVLVFLTLSLPVAWSESTSDKWAFVRLIYASPSMHATANKGTLTLDGFDIAEASYGRASAYVEADPEQAVKVSVNGQVSDINVNFQAGYSYSVVAYDTSVTGGTVITTVIDYVTPFFSTAASDEARVRPLFVGLPAETFPIEEWSYDLYGVRGDCYNCLHPKLAALTYPIQGGSNAAFSVDTTFPFTFSYRNSTGKSVPVDPRGKPTFTKQFDSAGSYTLLVFTSAQHGTVQMHVVADHEGNPDIYWTLLWYLLGYIACLTTACVTIGWVTRRLDSKKQLEELDEEGGYARLSSSAEAADSKSGGGPPLVQVSAAGSHKKKKSSRVVALDCFRGMSLFIMIFVNYGGGGYWFLDHSKWNGLTVADLVFPWFIFMMGVSMAISFRKPKKLHGVVKRSISLFMLGLFLSQAQILPQARVMGVLQRFGISYLVNALILMYVSKGEVRATSPWRDLLPYGYDFLIIAGFVVVWLLITFTMNVPGCGVAYLGPGGELGDWGAFRYCTGGAAGYIDKVLLGINHLYDAPTPQPVYNTQSYDPEGLLGCLTSIVLVYFGVQAGRVAVMYKDHKERLLRWCVWGVVLCAFAANMCGLSQNDGLIPINKNMWSLSFVLMLAGMANIALSLCYLLTDVTKVWSGLPFVPMGMNSILVYCGSEVFQYYFPFSYQSALTHQALLVQHLLGVSVWLLIAYIQYEKKQFFSL